MLSSFPAGLEGVMSSCPDVVLPCSKVGLDSVPLPSVGWSELEESLPEVPPVSKTLDVEIGS